MYTIFHVPSLNNWYHESWRLWVKEHIAYIEILITLFFLEQLIIFGFFNLLDLLVFANQPTVHSGGVSMQDEGLWLLALVTCDEQQVIVSPVCRNKKKMFSKIYTYIYFFYFFFNCSVSKEIFTHNCI